MNRHNEIAALMGRVCHGENGLDIIVATGVP